MHVNYRAKALESSTLSTRARHITRDVDRNYTNYFSGLEDHDIYHIHQEVQQLFLSVELTRLRLQPHVLRLDVCPQKYALQVQQSFSQYVQAIRER